MDRRQFLYQSGLVGVSTMMTGCRHDNPPLISCSKNIPGILVPQQTRVNTASSPLTIDVHSHIFNGHDVPLVDYFTRAVVHAPPPLDELLKLILGPAAWVIRRLAPDAKEECDQLRKLISDHDAASPNAFATTEARLRNEIASDDQQFIIQIIPFANEEPFRTKYREAERQELEVLGIQSVRPLSDSIDGSEIEAALQYMSVHPTLEAQGIGMSKVARIWPFLRRIASRRYHNAFRLMDLYGTAAGPVDAFAVATVDYDASLQPSTPSTTIADQIHLMEAISILTNGRVLPFVGYDPRRDIKTNGGALQDVKDAVEKHGHIGVKLYPPMGFAAYGNKKSTLDCGWPKNDSDYGDKMDVRLGELYAWALSRGVPILAHSNTSSGITRDCEKNGGERDWGAAINAFNNLNVCAGHFGGLPKSNNGLSPRMNGFIDLMKKVEAKNFYADLAYLPGLFVTGSASGNALAARLNETAAGGKVSDHLVYGSDWYMLSQDPAENGYAHEAVNYLRRAGGDSLVSTVMGVNPVKLLGLAGGSTAQAAAEGGDFLTQNGVTPHWRKKLPQMSFPDSAE